MAESSLSLGFPDFEIAVGRVLNYGVDSSTWSAAKAAEVNRIVQAGYRQVLYPPAIEGVDSGYEWSFLKPVTTITTVADTADQDLPDDFGRLIRGFTFVADEQCPAVLADVGEGRIRELRQRNNENARPRVAGIRIKAGTGTTGQRREVMWYPEPDDAYVLSYKYEAFVGALSDSLPYPLGGMKHAELVRESCLASAEAFVDDTHGIHWERFVAMLIASIARDRRESAKFFGNVGCTDEYDDDYATSFYNYTLSVSGVSIE